MSYMRGANYIWRGEDDVHIWAENGYDYWDDSVWFAGKSKKTRKTCSGVRISMSALDELVVMRCAQMTQKEFHAAVQRAIKKYAGNFGADGLLKTRFRANLLKTKRKAKKHRV